MNNKKRFFAGHSFGGGWKHERSPIDTDWIINEKMMEFFTVEFSSDKFFKARGQIGRRMIVVTADFDNLKFDDPL